MIVTEQLGDAISTLGRAEFDETFHKYCGTLSHAVGSAAIVIPKHGEPRRSTVGCSSKSMLESVKEGVSVFARSGYLTDIPLRNFRRKTKTVVGIVNAHDVAPSELRYEHYYSLGISQSLYVIGRVGYTVLYLGFFRNAGEYFHPSEINAITASAPLLIRLIHRHDQLSRTAQLLKLLDGEGVWDASHKEHCRRATSLFRDTLLSCSTISPREAEICAMTMAGYTATAIGLNCGISPHTVATYRKRAFLKLGIANKNALFGVYYDAINRGIV